MSWSNPDETRLRRHLFDPQYQTEDLLTVPVAGPNEFINVNVTIHIVKLIALVKVSCYLTYTVP